MAARTRMSIVRIIAHWSVTGYRSDGFSAKHYHFMVEGSGRVKPGCYKPEDNLNCRKGGYAAHTRRKNTGSIGIACMAMKGAKSETDYGRYPIKEAQFEAMCKYMAGLCHKYDIAVTDKTVLSHAEVEKNLGARQNGKWDIAVLPHAGLRGAKICGDYMRDRVRHYLNARTIPNIPFSMADLVEDAAMEGRSSSTIKAQIGQWLAYGGGGTIISVFGERLPQWAFTAIAILMVGIGLYAGWHIISERQRKKKLARLALEDVAIMKLRNGLNE